MKILFGVVLVLAVMAGCESGAKGPIQGNIASDKVKEGNKECPAKKLCPQLQKYEAACRSGSSEVICKKFVETYQLLSGTSDCLRSFDKDYVPAIWVCDEQSKDSVTLQERAAETLSKLKYPFAARFFKSEEFRSTLDGELAAEYMEKSQN